MKSVKLQYNTQKSVVSIYKIAERKKTIPFTISPPKIKYLKINQGSKKTYILKTKKTFTEVDTNRKVFNAHGLEERI